MFNLRDYQQDAIAALYDYLEQQPGNPLLVLPTGAGKSLIIAALVKGILFRWPTQRVMMLTHVKELIEQNYQKLRTLWPQAPVGIYSASIGKKQARERITFAGIQSIYRKSTIIPRQDLIIIDEAHLVPKKAEGMYRAFLEGVANVNPNVRVVGLTATPYRLQGGMLCEGDDRIFSEIAYELPVTDLIDRGFLCRVVPKQTHAEIDTRGVKKRAGEFIARDLERAAQAEGIVEKAVVEIVHHGKDRRSWLVFCVGIKHAQKVLDELRTHGINAEAVFGDTPKQERERILNDYKAGKLRALVNVSVLTTGFDAPQTDLIAVLRPTQSAGLWVQIVGRGMRTAEGKADCLVLDFGGNVMRHGPIDKIKPKNASTGETGEPMAKVCPECEVQNWIAARVCVECGYEFPINDEPKHDETASTISLLSSNEQPVTKTVDRVFYRRHKKLGKPDSLRVDYACGLDIVSEWVCLWHQGFAKTKAERWWMERSGEGREWIPPTIEDAIALSPGLRRPVSIVVKPEGQYRRIISYEWNENEHAERDGSDPDRDRGSVGTSEASARHGFDALPF